MRELPYVAVPLTEEQRRLYLTSPTFKQGVDALIRGVLPVYLEGLALRAVAMDRDTKAAIDAAEWRRDR